ncbi:hypothetical protein I6F35_21655 [Bradyrhizobium sp. BRP22]|uniref:hypothetical protein n=1 Tax=Bradyrhizobium sp. BRP22 TaxID=2793821 RepID=UPI001CD5DBD5|nr:hypothetical protein [Bradyrhizobium sp. BRP22]MCA1455787.1 hypothetical protein [Bradyrhizobium sp. BRP22]
MIRWDQAWIWPPLGSAERGDVETFDEQMMADIPLDGGTVIDIAHELGDLVSAMRAHMAGKS